MSVVNSFTQVVDASGQLRLANANFLYLISSTAAVTISLQKGGSTEIFQNAIGGLQLARVKGWDWAFFNAAAGTTLTFYYGISSFREDITILQQQIATVAGTVSTVTAPAVTVTDAAQVPCPNAAQTAVVPQNLLRRGFTLSLVSTAVTGAAVFIRKTGGANNLMEMQAGITYPFNGTYGVDVRNDSGGALNVMVFEES